MYPLLFSVTTTQVDVPSTCTTKDVPSNVLRQSSQAVSPLKLCEGETKDILGDCVVLNSLTREKGDTKEFRRLVLRSSRKGRRETQKEFRRLVLGEFFLAKGEERHKRIQAGEERHKKNLGMYMSPAMALNEQKGKDDIPKSQYQKGVKHLCEKGHLNAVPKKYILPVSERPTKSSVEHSNVVKQNLQLPIIDFSELLGSNRPRVLRSLANACQHYGFFQLVNHCISEDVVRRMIDVNGRFFDLPLEERAKYMTTDMRAPIRCGTSFSQTKDSCEGFLETPVPSLTRFTPPLACFTSGHSESGGHQCRRNQTFVPGDILESLGIVEANQEEDDNILKEFENESQMMVASFYPPCPQPDLTLGMPPHSDYGFLTLLLQDEVEGLQIQHQDKWVTVQPIPNAFVVNVGDHLEIYSNGKYKSVLHTIVVNEIKSRVSVASLHSVSKMMVPVNNRLRKIPFLRRLKIIILRATYNLTKPTSEPRSGFYFERFDIYIAYFRKLAPTDVEKREELEPEKRHANRGRILAFQSSKQSFNLWCPFLLQIAKGGHFRSREVRVYEWDFKISDRDGGAANP
ncbi:Protein DMR6-LIKE OXYGENASE 1 [Glycine soja]